MTWIDACCYGGSARDDADGSAAVARLLGELTRIGADGALVQSRWANVISPDYANQQLFDDLAGHASLIPAPEVTPEGGEAFIDRPADMVADLAKRGAGAAVVHPRQHGFLLSTWCAGDLLAALEARRLPLMVWINEVEPEHLIEVCEAFPALPVIVQGVPRTGYQRTLYPLMKRYRQLRVVLAPPHSAHLGVEYLATHLDRSQLLWGTNYPAAEPGASIAGVMYAELDEATQAAVMGGNMKQLIEEVRRD